MNSFEQSRKIEHRSMEVLKNFLDERGDKWVVTDKGPLSKFMQETLGDFIINTARRECWTVECKAELSDRYGNVFLETWSNRNLESRESYAVRGCNPGWMYKSRADVLFYHFIESDKLLIGSLFKLQQWFFGHVGDHPKFEQFPEKRQRKYDQFNDTWGRLVPIKSLVEEVGFKIVNPLQTFMFPAKQSDSEAAA